MGRPSERCEMTTTAGSPADDDEALILATVRELVRDTVAPRAAEIDASGEFPWDIQKLFAQTGLLGIPIPAAYGGLGGTFRTYVKVVEEIAKSCASSSLIVAVQELAVLPILIGGSDEQKQRFVPKLASGEWVGAYALTESGSGSDAAGSMRMRARRDGDGDGYLLDGTKIWITQGGIADVVTVFAVTDAEAGARGISAFVVEKGTPGFSIGKLEKKWAFADRRRSRCSSTTAAYRRQTCSAPRAKGSRSRCKSSINRGPASPRKRWESPQARSTTRRTILKRALRSANHSRNSKACNSCSPI